VNDGLHQKIFVAKLRIRQAGQWLLKVEVNENQHLKKTNFRVNMPGSAITQNQLKQ